MNLHLNRYPTIRIILLSSNSTRFRSNPLAVFFADGIVSRDNFYAHATLGFTCKYCSLTAAMISQYLSDASLAQKHALLTPAAPNWTQHDCSFLDYITDKAIFEFAKEDLARLFRNTSIKIILDDIFVSQKNKTVESSKKCVIVFYNHNITYYYIGQFKELFHTLH